MIQRMKWCSLALGSVLLLSACGGGGGDAGTPVNGGGGTVTTGASGVIRIEDSAAGDTNRITAGGSYQVRAIFKDSRGQAVSGRLVTFAITGADVASVNPATALTDSTGLASVSISAKAFTSAGASTVKATAEIDSESVEITKDFAVDPANVSLTAIALGQTSLASAGTTSMRVGVQVNGAVPVANAVSVSWVTSCGRINGQTAMPVAVSTDGSGLADATYTAIQEDGLPCSGAIQVSASAPGANPVASAIQVAAPSADAIQFVEASPTQIFLPDSGAATQSVLKFKVTANGAPMQNVPVLFSIVENPGGAGLGGFDQVNARPIVTTDADGVAQVTVFSGTVPGPVRVRAELASDPLVYSVSQFLSVASGAPSQSRMSLSVATFNIEGWNYDGVSTELTVRIADRQGNPVDDGTTINFTSEGGQIARSCSTELSQGVSACSVNFVSQQPRPDNARVSVLAHLEGSDDYLDINENNAYDEAVDTLIDQGDAYRDDNENGRFDVGEFVVPRGSSGLCAGRGGIYPARANSCDGLPTATVRAQSILILSSSYSQIETGAVTTGGFDFNLFGNYGSGWAGPRLPMPAGTSISARTSRSECVVAVVSPAIVPVVSSGFNPEADLVTSHSIGLDKCQSGDRVFVEVTTPKGVVTVHPITLP